MTFFIEFKNQPVPRGFLQPGDRAELAEILLGDSLEDLSIVINDWSRDDYVSQWIEAINKLLESENSESVLITQFFASRDRPYALELWPMYRQKDTVYTQNYYASPAELTYPLTREGIYASIRKRAKGASEWAVPLEDFRRWAQALGSKGQH